MLNQEFLDPKITGLWVIDIQEKLFPLIDRSSQILDQICFVIEAFKALNLPLIVTEQYPKGLGKTIEQIQKILPKDQEVFEKTSFSGYYNSKLREAVDRTGVHSWILVGIEAHVCILQTAKDLLQANKRVVVLNDAVSSRSLYDFSTAMGEMRDCGVRISSVETVLYELIRDADTDAFRAVISLIKAASHAQA